MKFLIHGQSIESTDKLRRKIEGFLPNGSVLTSTDIEKTKDIVNERLLKLFLLEVESFTKKEMVLIKDFRLWGLSFPVLVLTDNIAVSDVDGKLGDNKPHFIEASAEDKKLLGVIKKLIRTKQIPQQLFVRYHTNQRVLIESHGTTKSLDSSMYNLSKGGAYCEFDPELDIKFTVGDILKLSVPLSEMSRKHALNAKVVWTTKKGRYSGRNGFGLKFVNNDDFYRQLLGKLF